MIYSVSMTLILVLFLVIGITFGFNRAVGMLPVLFIIFLLVAFFGWFIFNFFWLILLIIFINYLRNRNQPKRTRRTYYYSILPVAVHHNFLLLDGKNLQNLLLNLEIL